MLAAHHWQGKWVGLQDIRKGPPPDNGLEVMYHSATLGERMLGHGDPNNPVVWVFGSTDDDDRNMGMGIVVEYADRRGEPQRITALHEEFGFGSLQLVKGFSAICRTLTLFAREVRPRFGRTATVETVPHTGGGNV